MQPCNKVNNYFGDKYNAKTEINVVTNIVKQELIKNAIFSDEKFLLDTIRGIIPIKIGIQKYLLLIGIEFFNKVVFVSQ